MFFFVLKLRYWDCMEEGSDMRYILILFFMFNSICYAEKTCVCLGFNGLNYSCNINLRPEVDRANEVHMCQVYCKKTNCKGSKIIN